jgi:enoyl-CoA hydratase/carnithine racemase
MVLAVASRVVPRQRISRAMAKETAAEAARMEELARNADAPMSVNRIPTRAGANVKSARVAIRPMGNSRRVFLLDPHLEAEEMEGFAHRIQALSKNEGINSILIASDDKDDAEMNCLPRYVTDAHEPNFGGLTLDFDPAPNQTWHVSGGYDPLKAAEMMSKEGADDKSLYLLDSMKQLSLAFRGDAADTRVPVITMPHGVVTDAGYALCMGGYVLATRQTSFRILNPSRGLSLDPIGFSYLLPRLGWEHEQRSSIYPGCGMILALSGYEANCFDMVETGLATHLVSDSDALPLLEHNLASCLPWNQQKLVQKPMHFYGQQPPSDANARMRNVTIANLIEQMTEHSSNPSNSLPYDYGATNMDDPALDTDQVPWDSGFFSSDLVDMAAHFDKIFQQEKSLVGLMERLRQAGAQQSEDPDEKEGIRVANELVERMERQSPLALRVVHQLMKMGGGRLATMENCMDREAKAQHKLLGRADFSEWAKHVRKHGDESAAPAFAGWQHENVAAVSAEEVDEILS